MKIKQQTPTGVKEKTLTKVERNKLALDGHSGAKRDKFLEDVTKSTTIADLKTAILEYL